MSNSDLLLLGKVLTQFLSEAIKVSKSDWQPGTSQPNLPVGRIFRIFIYLSDASTCTVMLCVILKEPPHTQRNIAPRVSIGAAIQRHVGGFFLVAPSSLQTARRAD